MEQYKMNKNNNSTQPRNENGQFLPYESFQWYLKEPNIRVGYWDIEGSTLKGNTGFMLSWAIKERDGMTFYDYLKPEDRKGENWKKWDRRIVESMLNTMKKFDVLVGYYIDGYDTKMSRSRAMFHNLVFPRYRELYSIDIYWTVRSKMGLSRNSLAVSTEFLDIAGKTRLGDYWYETVLGGKTAMKELVKHNIADVEITESLHKRLEVYQKFNKRSI